MISKIAGMGDRGIPENRARQREQQRRQQAQRTRTTKARSDPAEAGGGPERRAAATACGWCGGPITARARGPIPKWCSATCRHRAWEQTRAAASGRAAVQIVERRVQVSVRQSVTRRDWPQALADLAAQLDDGRIYDRDLAGLSLALDAVLAAYHRRHHAGLRAEDASSHRGPSRPTSLTPPPVTAAVSKITGHQMRQLGPALPRRPPGSLPYSSGSSSRGPGEAAEPVPPSRWSPVRAD